MSIFLKVEKFGGASALFRLRGLCTGLGEDESGILTCRAPSKLFFTLYQVDDRAILKSADEPLLLNGAPFTARQHTLQPGDRAAAYDYTFTFLPTSSISETLAQADASFSDLCALDDEASVPKLVYEMASLRRCCPLFPGITFTIGCASESVVYINLPGVHPQHCAIQYENGEMRVQRMEGAIEVDGHEVDDARLLKPGTAIKLLPTGIELKIRA